MTHRAAQSLKHLGAYRVDAECIRVGVLLILGERMVTQQMQQQEPQVELDNLRDELRFTAREELQMAAQAYFDTQRGRLTYAGRVQQVVDAVLAQLIQ